MHPARAHHPVLARHRGPGTAPPLARAGRARRPRPRGGAAIAIAAGTGGKGGGDGANGATSSSSATRSETKSKPETQSSQPQTTTQQQQTTTQQQTQTTQPSQPAPGAQAKSDDPVALNDQGFALIGQGKSTEAVAPLQRSVVAFRAQDRKGEIGYAYALYNLGNALRLSGRPADAIPFLEERLQISSYKRGVVRKELETARKQAG